MRIYSPGIRIIQILYRNNNARLVALDRLHQETRKEEDDHHKKKGGDPFIVTKPPSANRGGVAEKYIKVSQ